ncbi:MAG: hypothetical protein NVSMB18_05500 [Acetobacteraceae bacterium]
MLHRIARRSALAGLVASCSLAQAWSATSGLPDAATLLVAGPTGGRADRWADLLSPALGRTLQQGAALPRQNVGGPDGVTGANQFEARAAPDGTTALLVPGSAALSWLTGDTRVKFDAARWVPVWAGTTAAALASRGRIIRGKPLRVAVASVVGPELAALLALDLMGVDVVPVQTVPNRPASLNQPDVDAVFLPGPVLRNEAALLAASGMTLAFACGTLSPAGDIVRDPAYPDLPTAQELVAQTQPESQLVGALRAVTAAVQLNMVLVLPQLSPAAVVAWWRRGCAALAQSPDVQAEAARTGTRAANPQMAGLSTAMLTAEVPVLLELRRWLNDRYQWRPA